MKVQCISNVKIKSDEPVIDLQDEESMSTESDQNDSSPATLGNDDGTQLHSVIDIKQEELEERRRDESIETDEAEEDIEDETDVSDDMSDSTPLETSSVNNKKRSKNKKSTNNEHNCTECTFKTPSSAILKQHMKVAHINRPCFKCILCNDFQTPIKVNMFNHIMEKHTENNPEHIKCLICHEIFIDRTKYIPHVEGVHIVKREKIIKNRTKLRCLKCNDQFVSRQGYSDHQTVFHCRHKKCQLQRKNDKKFSCLVKTYFCKTCTYTQFRCKFTLIRHFKTACPNGKEHLEDRKRNKVKILKGVRRIKKVKDSFEMVSICEVCKKVLNDKKEIDDHKCNVVKVE